MKKLFLRILPFALIMFTLITFIACNDRSENDDTSTDITVTVPGSGGNDDQEQKTGTAVKIKESLILSMFFFPTERTESVNC